MFIGYQNDKPTFLADTKEELENLPCVQLDKIEEHNFAVMYNGNIYISKVSLREAQKEYVHAVRNKYLVEFVDGPVSNPLRWADMDQDEKDMYTQYRRYLLDYTSQENWWEQNPKTLEEWKVG